MPDSDAAWAARLFPVYELYTALFRRCLPDAGLGGKLLWVHELDANGSALMRAANIAGAASLGGTADLAALRQANRDGVADFLVTSLDEALRILKNEVRKREAVSVGVSVDPVIIQAEMRERGVLPDLLPAADPINGVDLEWFLAQGSRRVEVDPLPEGRQFRAWASPAAEFDALAMAALPKEDQMNRRWLRLSPRYLGPAARRVRSLACPAEVAAQLAAAALQHESS